MFPITFRLLKPMMFTVHDTKEQVCLLLKT